MYHPSRNITVLDPKKLEALTEDNIERIKELG